MPETKGRELESIYKLFIKKDKNARNGDGSGENGQYGHDNAAVTLSDESMFISGTEVQVQVELNPQSKDTKM